MLILGESTTGRGQAPPVSAGMGRLKLFNTLSGRFLLLTMLFMLAEVLIFVPSVARFRQDYILSRLERAQIASLALLATDEIDPPRRSNASFWKMPRSTTWF